MRIERLADYPIITAAHDAPMVEHGHANINGPSLIRVPDWVRDPLGRYYLYFAHHQGSYIRLAYADALAGPWRMHEPGTLQIDQTPFQGHIASPDVHVDPANRRIVMYYHGHDWTGLPWKQITCAAVSEDGLTFESFSEPLCQSYLRMFTWRGGHYGIAMPGQFYRSADGLTGFEGLDPTIADTLCGSRPFVHPTYLPRHFAVQVRGNTLRLFYTRIGDCPEHILTADVVLTDDWTRWQPDEPVSLLKPELPWEGAGREPVASRCGAVHEPACQLRDPAIYEEGGRMYLLYAVAGEHGIAIAEVFDD